MVVMKFGGSSVATSAALARVCAIVAAERRRKIVVVSALGGVTDALLAAAAQAGAGDLAGALEGLRGIRERHEAIASGVRGQAERAALLQDLGAGWRDAEALLRAASRLGSCSPAASDAIVAQGELASSRLAAAVLNDAGVRARWIDARQVVITDRRHQHAAPAAAETAARLTEVAAPLVGRGDVPVIGGFVGATADGVTTTLGRGGSDYSASLVGACLGAAEIQIWTDVDGMLTADPRVFRRARPVARLSFREASALAGFGAKVLHPSAVQPAFAAGIPVRILNARRPSAQGTVVTEEPIRRSAPAAGIACLGNLCAIDVPLPDGAGRLPALASAFEACALAQAVPALATVSDAGVSLVVGEGPEADRVAARLGPAAPTRRGGLALIAVVGDRLASGVDVPRRLLAALDGIPVHLLSRTPGSIHVACVIDEKHLARAVSAIHSRVFERGRPPDSGRGVPADGPRRRRPFGPGGTEAMA
ncbi:MAG TPA: aspartate kinase [Vicinamibacterales bacterium]|nr:aspartate kinase [Vicinamibacterales bacterium]HPK72241.1 aspartate kinase [Vicinamibacterales bacterium]